MTKTDTAIMEQCLSDLRGMLKERWDEIASMKDENEGRIKVSAAFLISFKGNEQAVKTTLTFGRRVTESRESIINPNQINLPLDGVNGSSENGPGTSEDGGKVESIAKPRKTRQKAPQEAAGTE